MADFLKEVLITLEDKNNFLLEEFGQKTIYVSFPDFSRRFSVSLANSIDTFWEVLLKRFTLLMDKPDSGFLFGKNGCPRWSIHSYIYIPC